LPAIKQQNAALVMFNSWIFTYYIKMLWFTGWHSLYSCRSEQAG